MQALKENLHTQRERLRVIQYRCNIVYGTPPSEPPPSELVAAGQEAEAKAEASKGFCEPPPSELVLPSVFEEAEAKAEASKIWTPGMTHDSEPARMEQCVTIPRLRAGKNGAMR